MITSNTLTSPCLCTFTKQSQSVRLLTFRILSLLKVSFFLLRNSLYIQNGPLQYCLNLNVPEFSCVPKMYNSKLLINYQSSIFYLTFPFFPEGNSLFWLLNRFFKKNTDYTNIKIVHLFFFKTVFFRF